MKKAIIALLITALWSNTGQALWSKTFHKKDKDSSGRFANFQASRQAKKLDAEKAAERLRRRLFRERLWTKFMDGLSGRVKGGGVGRTLTTVGLVGVGLAVFVCHKGGLGCNGEREQPQGRE